MTPDEARALFVAEQQAFSDAADGLQALLAAYARERGFHAVVDARAKTVASFVKKSHNVDEHGAPKYTDPWAQIRDKVGARVIVDSLDDLARFRAAMESEALAGAPFEEIEDKTLAADPASMFYPGIHAQVVVSGFTTSGGDPIEAEVQLRTKAQDLWAATSHKLVYKGTVTPARETFRRVMRLSVLVEMFDEEVGRAMNELAADPAYRAAGLLHLAEAEYLRFVGEPGEPELSLEVLGAIEGLLPEDREVYEAELRAFVSGNEDKLRDAYATYGVFSEFAGSYAYWLFSQPESVIVFELIDTKPQQLAQTLPEELLEPVRHLFAAWGREIPEF